MENAERLPVARKYKKRRAFEGGDVQAPVAGKLDHSLRHERQGVELFPLHELLEQTHAVVPGCLAEGANAMTRSRHRHCAPLICSSAGADMVNSRGGSAP